MERSIFRRWLAVVAGLILGGATLAAGTFRVATFNLENYLDEPAGTRPVKSAESKAAIRESLHALRADVVALQEMGRPAALQELRASLKAEGLDYPHWEHVAGFDTNIHVAVLSRFPITARRPHTNDAFLLFGRRFRVARGFAELDLQVHPRYAFTLITAHLKSRRPVPEGDEAEMREQEALILRTLVETRLQANPRLNLVVLGDFNDAKDAKSTRALIGRGRHALIDTRPAERAEGLASASDASGRAEARAVTWTHYYGKEDTYSRIDYVLLSPAMAREWMPEETYVLALPNWGMASDHRPVVAAFRDEDGP